MRRYNVVNYVSIFCPREWLLISTILSFMINLSFQAFCCWIVCLFLVFIYFKLELLTQLAQLTQVTKHIFYFFKLNISKI